MKAIEGGCKMKMTFGKYAGTDIKDIPSDYLRGVCIGVPDKNMRCAAMEEWKLRELLNEHFYEED